MAVVDAERHHENLVSELIASVETYNPGVDKELIRRSFDLAERPTGSSSPFRRGVHQSSVGVAQICATLHLDEQTIAAALLHDVVEDTETELDEVLAEFGPEIAQLVEGVTKLTRIRFQSREQAEAENYRKMIVAMAQDVRVILIKLADRLHNMRTIEYLGKQKQVQKAKETIEVYAPLAHRLGIHEVKWELEDLAFGILHPRKYAEIKAMVADRRADREAQVETAGKTLQGELEKADIPADIAGRAKHFYSIYDKMAKKGREFNEIYDLTAMRVIVERGGDEGTRDCYGALGIIHSLWKPMPGRFKDFVAMPKLNRYRSLHTTVIGPSGMPLEIQVRTREMHEEAQYGIAAHWLYKRGNTQKGDDEWVTWVKSLMDWQADEQDAVEYMRTLRTDLFDDEVYVFTPKGEVKTLPAGGTPIDFAYAVHTDVGHKTVGAKVNGRIVPLHYKLKNGDFVEILTSKSGRGPSRDWMSLAASSRARTRFASGSSGRRKARPRPRAERPSTRRSRHRAFPIETAGLGSARAGDPGSRLQESGGLLPRRRLREARHRAGRQQGAAAPEDGRGRRRACGRAEARRRRAAPSRATRSASSSRVSRTFSSGSPSAALRCRGRDQRLHLARPRDHDPPRRLPQRQGADAESGAVHARGVGGKRQDELPVQIAVEAWDRARLLEDVARTFSEHGANIVSYGGSVEDGMARNWYTAELGDVNDLRSLLSALRHLDAAFDAYRVNAELSRRTRGAGGRGSDVEILVAASPQPAASSSPDRSSTKARESATRFASSSSRYEPPQHRRRVGHARRRRGTVPRPVREQLERGLA